MTAKVSHAQLVAESKRAPLLNVPALERKAYYDACRKTLEAPTPTGLAALGRIPTTERAPVIAKLAEVPQVSRAIQEARRELQREKLDDVAAGGGA